MAPIKQSESFLLQARCAVNEEKCTNAKYVWYGFDSHPLMGVTGSDVRVVMFFPSGFSFYS